MSSPEEQEPEREPFRIAIHNQGVDGAWVALDGDLDLGGTRELIAALDGAMSTSRLIVLDLRGLTFMDTAGLAAISAASHRARSDGRRLVIIQGPHQIERLTGLTEISSVLEIADLGPSGLHLESPPDASA